MMNRFVANIVGPPEFERYVIRDNRVDEDRFFVGPGEWTGDLRLARKYADVESLSAETHAITVRELEGMGVRRYTLPVEITVLGDATEDEVRRYLFRAFRMGLDYENCGDGPNPGSAVLAQTIIANIQPALDTQPPLPALS